MTQVLFHDYGKGKVSLIQIRAAVRSVRAANAVRVGCGAPKARKIVKKPVVNKVRRGA